MRIKINSTEFYNRQKLELYRFLKNGKKTLHISLEENYKNLKIDNNSVNSLLVNENIDVYKLLSEIENQSYGLIVVTDIFEISDDIYKLLKTVSQKLESNGKVLISTINPKWKLILYTLELFKLKNKYEKSHTNLKKIISLSRSAGLDFIYFYTKQIIPFKLFGVGNFLNKLFEVLFFKFNLGIKSYVLFSKIEIEEKIMTKSVIIPAKNEEKNLEILFSNFPKLKNLSEVILISAKSKDKTLEVSKAIALKNKDLKINVIEQKSNGKANAVFEAINHTNGDLIAILDSDISVDPKTLPSFFEIIEKGHADFVNGTRLIYPIEKKSMRPLNKIGNIFFKLIISIVIKNNLSDALCGTKVFKKTHIEKIFSWRENLNFLDPFGDFDLIFSAAYSGEKILEYPVHYKARIYGKTQINRFRDGFKLIVYFLRSFLLFNTSK